MKLTKNLLSLTLFASLSLFFAKSLFFKKEKRKKQKMADNGFKYSHEQIGERVWCVVEDDPYGQYPFLYVLLGDDKCIVIDTGTGLIFTEGIPQKHFTDLFPQRSKRFQDLCFFIY